MPGTDHRAVTVKGEELRLDPSLTIAQVKVACQVDRNEDAYTWDGEHLPMELPDEHTVRWVPEGGPLLFGPYDVDEFALLMQHDESPDPPDSYRVTFPENYR
jgi:hypothetical protein